MQQALLWVLSQYDLDAPTLLSWVQVLLDIEPLRVICLLVRFHQLDAVAHTVVLVDGAVIHEH